MKNLDIEIMGKNSKFYQFEIKIITIISKNNILGLKINSNPFFPSLSFSSRKYQNSFIRKQKTNIFVVFYKIKIHYCRFINPHKILERHKPTFYLFEGSRTQYFLPICERNQGIIQVRFKVLHFFGRYVFSTSEMNVQTIFDVFYSFHGVFLNENIKAYRQQMKICHHEYN